MVESRSLYDPKFVPVYNTFQTSELAYLIHNLDAIENPERAFNYWKESLQSIRFRKRLLEIESSESKATRFYQANMQEGNIFSQPRIIETHNFLGDYDRLALCNDDFTLDDWDYLTHELHLSKRDINDRMVA